MLTEAQQVAVEQVMQFTSTSRQIRLLAKCEENECVVICLEIKTSCFTQRADGLEVFPRERVIVVIARDYPATPPLVRVKHQRWAGFPHVLLGTRLCIYLDPGTEWNPAYGMHGFLLRLWGWFEEAIGGRFDPLTALYHPVGGVLHRTAGTPTVVAMQTIPADVINEGIVHRIGLRPRTNHRIDIEAWKPPYDSDLVPGLLVALPNYLPRGGGARLSDLLKEVRHQLDRNQRRRLETSLRHAIQGLKAEEHLYVIIAVPYPSGSNRVPRHLIGWRQRASDVATSLSVARGSTSSDFSGKEPRVEWTYVDDQRPEVAVRRDSERPVNVYAGAKIAVWGCGALGSWIAELLVRAGAQRVVLRDPSFVTRGLLVRQNYTEADVGCLKAEALADRLQRLSDSCEVKGLARYAQEGLRKNADGCDFIFESTVNTAVNDALDNAQRSGLLRVPVVQVATDIQTATLGIITVTDGITRRTTSELDQALHKETNDHLRLAPFTTFWNQDAYPPLTPALGCSVPTFHGSAADSMGMAASALSVAATTLSRQVSCGYFLSLPHSPFEVPALVSVPPPT